MAEHPSLFQQSLESFTEARERILTEAFHAALAGNDTSSDVKTTSKPINLTAHDPIRYVGDMFAWVHSSAVTELETADALFVAGDDSTEGMRLDRPVDPNRLLTHAGEEVSDAGWTLGDLVDRSIVGVSRMLRQRVEQVIHSNEELTVAYQLVALIRFYSVTLEKLVGKQSILRDGIEDLKSHALRQFRALVRDHITHNQMGLQPVPSDLGPPLFFHDALAQLETILKIYDASLSASNDRDHDVSFILSEAFDPCMAACKNLTKSLEHPEDVIFFVNCALTATKTLRKFDFANKHTDALQIEVTSEAERLVEYQTDVFRVSSGLDRLLDQRDKISENTLEQASQQLDQFLPSALMDAMETMGPLLDVQLSRKIIEAAADKFCDDFELLERNIDRLDRETSESHRTRLRSFFPRTIAEIRTLLT
ncbi:hypothetical protein CDD80_4877 [Ophiocordyceps camponoti-rufipedis]|uniref:Conserved Oligomeric Golgi complex subunit 6 C-terminal domain-containing protein n=1 Tax=Ophiocordyceps camponoti-rufipedis TaxID=2004952 RepID=A0A2C5ZJ22_9HYPO|nr:hypothetical protein CDD80_4877 [Ophiocordyceps camponoti-rufipedis]